MSKKIILPIISVLLVLCLVCCSYLLFFDRGRDGKDGLNGLDGQDGVDGRDGLNGSNGSDGARWYVDSGVPASDLGKDGDCYFDLNDNSLYQKNAGKWESFGVLHQEPPEAEWVSVTFDAAEGTLPEGERSKKIQKGTSFTLPVPSREGFEFAGWFYGEGANAAQANDLTVFTQDVVLVARWKQRNSIKLDQTEASGKVRLNVPFAGEYNGTASVVLYLERDGSRYALDEAEAQGWIEARDFWNDRDKPGRFEGYINFAEAGEYDLLFRAEEPDGVVEAKMHIVIE